MAGFLPCLIVSRMQRPASPHRSNTSKAAIWNPKSKLPASTHWPAPGAQALGLGPGPSGLVSGNWPESAK